MDVMREVLDLVRWDRSRRDGSDVAYYFRGERKAHPDEVSLLSAPQKPGVYYALDRLKHESDIFNEALRAFPEEFAKDRTTFEKLVRMEHYGYPTRLMNVTPKLMTALGMVRSEGYAPNAEDDRAGFFWEKGSKTSEELLRDIHKVWCVHPMANNIRVNFQVGEFFLFGCDEQKKCLETTFDESDYDREDATSYGIARIGVFAVNPSAKRELEDFRTTLNIGDERLYPDFEHHSKMIRDKYKKKEE